MNLSSLAKMAQLAADDQEGGDATAAPTFRAFLLANLADVAHAFVKTEDVMRHALEGCSDENLPKYFADTARAKGIRAASKNRSREAKENETARVAAELEAGALVTDGHTTVAVTFSGTRLAYLASLRTTDHVCFYVGETRTLVPLAPVRRLAKVRHPAEWSVILHDGKLTVRWGTRGYWRAGALALESEERNATAVHVTERRAA